MLKIDFLLALISVLLIVSINAAVIFVIIDEICTSKYCIWLKIANSFLCSLSLLNYFTTMFVDPGSASDFKSYHIPTTVAQTLQPVYTQLCKKCDLSRLPKCHHCKLCKKCVLGMDHHCPYVSNCVGYYN